MSGSLTTGLAAPALAAAGDVTAVSYDYSPNGVRNPGTSAVADAARGQSVTVSRYRTGVGIDGPAQFWLVPDSGELTVGEHALGTGPGQVRFIKSMEDCTNQTGRLSVRDYEATADAVLRMSATLQVTCTFARFSAEIRWHVDEPYRAAQAPRLVQLPVGAVGQARQAQVTVTATGTLPVTFGDLTLNPDPDAAVFSVSDNGCSGQTIAPGGTCTFLLHAQPTHVDGSFARLRLQDDTAHGAREIPVEAWSFNPPAAPQVSVHAGYDGLGIRAQAVTATGAGPTTSFRFYRVSPAGEQLIGEAPAASDGTGFVSDPLPPGASATYRAVAVGTGGAGPASADATGTVPTRPVPSAGPVTAAVVDRVSSVDVSTATQVTALPGTLRFSTGASGPISIRWGSDLVPGTYSGPTAAVRVEAPTCGGAQTVTVHEAAVHADGRPEVFAATYRFDCPDNPLVGEVRWRSNVGFRVADATPAFFSFDRRAAGTTTTKAVTVANRGTETLSLGTPAMTYGDAFTIARTTCGSSLAAGATCQVDVSFRPTAEASERGVLTLPDDSTAGRRTVTFVGNGTTPPVTPNTRVAPTVSRVQVDWDGVRFDSGGEQLLGYEVWRGPVGGPMTRLASTTASVTLYDDRAVHPGERWQYAVRALNSVGSSQLVPQPAVTIPTYELMLYTHGTVRRLGHPLAPSALEAPELYQGPTGATTVSPAGDRIAYPFRPAGANDDGIAVAAADGTDLRRITSGATDVAPAFSPDGATIAFIRSTWAKSNTDNALWTVPAAGGTPRQVPGGAGAVNAEWLDGRTVLIVASDAGVGRLETVDTATGARRPLPGGEDVVGDIALSPDRRTIAVARPTARDDQGVLTTEVVLLPAAGGTPRVLATPGYDCATAGAFSPDGASLFVNTQAHRNAWQGVGQVALSGGDVTPWTAEGVDSMFVTAVRPAVAARTPSVSVSPGVITAGQRVTVTYTGTPGSTLSIYSKTQPATTYSRIGSVTLDSSGRGTSTHAPHRNTRIMAGTTAGAMSAQPLIQVRSVASLNATRLRTRTYRFSGTVSPALANRLVNVYRNGALVAQGRTSSTGVYAITRTLAAGTFGFVVKTPNDTYNLGATSRTLLLRVS